jgi:hypothetical protein
VRAITAALLTCFFEERGVVAMYGWTCVKIGDVAQCNSFQRTRAVVAVNQLIVIFDQPSSNIPVSLNGELARGKNHQSH